MLAEVKLVIVPKGAILTISKGEKVLDEERWAFPRSVEKSEAQEIAKAVFDDAYDSLNWMINSTESDDD